MQGTILVQADSLALPREEYDYNQTWPYYIQEHFKNHHLILRSSSAKDTNSLHRSTPTKDGREVEYYDPELIIIQLGIVDCAPRIFREYEKTILENIPSEKLKKASILAARKLRTRSPKRARVSKKQYRSNIKKYLTRAKKNQVQLVLLIKILPISDKYAEKNPKSEEQIHTYNEVLDDVETEVNICQTMRPLSDDPVEGNNIVDEYTIRDGYHLNTAGHQRLFKRIIRCVD